MSLDAGTPAKPMVLINTTVYGKDVVEKKLLDFSKDIISIFGVVPVFKVESMNFSCDKMCFTIFISFQSTIPRMNVLHLIYDEDEEIRRQKNYYNILELKEKYDKWVLENI